MSVRRFRLNKSTLALSGLLLAVSGFSQELVRNSAKPLNPDAGRVLRLESVYEISDASGEFFFRFPSRFQLDRQGRLYMLDQDQLLQFSPQGKFIRNFYKKGQGPGEIASRYQMISLVCFRDDVYVYDGRSKIIHFDGEGNLIGEVRQTAGQMFWLFGIAEGGYFMQGQTNAPMGGAPGFRENEIQAFLVSPDGTAREKILGFTSRTFEGPGFGMNWDNYMQVFNPRDGSLYVSQTCEYKVVRADLFNRQIIVSFTRDYPRVKFHVPDSWKDFYKKYNPPKKDFENDISELFVCGDKLWVKTSTTDKAKGALFDVFDPRGRFLDSFYLPNDMNLALADGDFIYVTEKDKDENILFRKCRVLNRSED